MQSLWQTAQQRPSFPSLPGDIKTDVLIIGGGIAGLLTAHFLQQAGVSYCLVEKGRIAAETTAHTTAKITVQHGLIYHTLLRRDGEQMAKDYLQANLQAFKEFERLAKIYPCDYEKKDNFVYCTTQKQRLEEECEALHILGYAAELCEHLPLPFSTVGAVCFRNQAQFHPLKFLYGLAKPLCIYENTAAQDIEGTVVQTNRGKIYAKRVVVATHFPFYNRRGAYFLKMYQHRSYVLALESDDAPLGMFVDDAKTGLSFRSYQNLFLLSGGGHRTGKQGGNWQELRAFAKAYYPTAEEKYFWAAQDCLTLDERPYIGNYSKKTPHWLVATGFQKWGMTGAMVAALLLRDRLTQREYPYAEVFSPSRRMLRPQLFSNAAHAVGNLLTPTAKRCPHMGCALQWNPAERSYDCPCHGSRFDKDGKLLENPAMKDASVP